MSSNVTGPPKVGSLLGLLYADAVPWCLGQKWSTCPVYGPLEGQQPGNSAVNCVCPVRVHIGTLGLQSFATNDSSGSVLKDEGVGSEWF